MTGTVKYWNDDRGFGFIRPDAGGIDVFVHYSDLEFDRTLLLIEGRAVEFETTPCARGFKAARVRAL